MIRMLDETHSVSCYRTVLESEVHGRFDLDTTIRTIRGPAAKSSRSSTRIARQVFGDGCDHIAFAG